MINGEVIHWIVMFAYSGFGAFLLWARAEAVNKQQNGYSDIVSLITSSDKIRGILSFVIFVVVGALVSMFFVAPITVPHALAGGMAWSRLAGKD